MGFFDIFKKKQATAPSVPSVSAEVASLPQPENLTDFLIALDNRISKKCNYGKEIEKLNEYEKTFFLTQKLEAEINNGGFDQFFFNSSGNFAYETVDAFQAIGAVKTAEICRKAINSFGKKIPKDRDKRMNFFDKYADDHVSNILDECDDAFYEYEEDLNQLNFDYIARNQAFFDLKELI